jgi:hypothetical protein
LFPFALLFVICGMFSLLAFMLQHALQTRRKEKALVNIHTTQE